MPEQIDLESVKEVQQQTWSAGDFSEVAPIVQFVSDCLVENVDVMPGERVLDVACGSGNVAIHAARQFADVTGIDYVPALIERAKERATAERLEIEFLVGDAEALPFDDDSFDVVISTFGAMFAPDQQRTADEMLRVCRSGGRIGMANWVPDGFVGETFKTMASHVPPPPGLMPPLLWGTEERVRELFGDQVTDLETERRTSRQRFHSPEHFMEFFQTNFGPTIKALERVGEDGREALNRDIREVVDRYDSGDERAVFGSDYLEIVATKS